MNYIEMKVFEVAKGHGSPYVTRFSRAGKDRQLDGYIGAQIGVDTKQKDKDTVYVIMTWESQEKFDAFQQGVHKEMHKNEKREKDENLLSYRSIRFETV